ncbi:mucin-2-like [Ornithodoros turicata]|uniref:mucin-2-like n=1 Tax=Ornithodoros turicata TaxID=34597 RepID=UPI003139A1D4
MGLFGFGVDSTDGVLGSLETFSVAFSDLWIYRCVKVPPPEHRKGVGRDDQWIIVGNATNTSLVSELFDQNVTSTSLEATRKDVTSTASNEGKDGSTATTSASAERAIQDSELVTEGTLSTKVAEDRAVFFSDVPSTAVPPTTSDVVQEMVPTTASPEQRADDSEHSTEVFPSTMVPAERAVFFSDVPSSAVPPTTSDVVQEMVPTTASPEQRADDSEHSTEVYSSTMVPAERAVFFSDVPSSAVPPTTSDVVQEMVPTTASPEQRADDSEHSTEVYSSTMVPAERAVFFSDVPSSAVPPTTSDVVQEMVPTTASPEQRADDSEHSTEVYSSTMVPAERAVFFSDVPTSAAPPTTSDVVQEMVPTTASPEQRADDSEHSTEVFPSTMVPAERAVFFSDVPSSAVPPTTSDVVQEMVPTTASPEQRADDSEHSTEVYSSTMVPAERAVFFSDVPSSAVPPTTSDVVQEMVPTTASPEQRADDSEPTVESYSSTMVPHERAVFASETPRYNNTPTTTEGMEGALSRADYGFEPLTTTEQEMPPAAVTTEMGHTSEPTSTEADSSASKATSLQEVKDIKFRYAEITTDQFIGDDMLEDIPQRRTRRPLTTAVHDGVIFRAADVTLPAGVPDVATTEVPSAPQSVATESQTTHHMADTSVSPLALVERAAVPTSPIPLFGKMMQSSKASAVTAGSPTTADRVTANSVGPVTELPLSPSTAAAQRDLHFEITSQETTATEAPSKATINMTQASPTSTIQSEGPSPAASTAMVSRDGVFDATTKTAEALVDRVAVTTEVAAAATSTTESPAVHTEAPTRQATTIPSAASEFSTTAPRGRDVEGSGLTTEQSASSLEERAGSEVTTATGITTETDSGAASLGQSVINKDSTFFTEMSSVSTFPAESSAAPSEESVMARSPLPERITTTTQSVSSPEERTSSEATTATGLPTETTTHAGVAPLGESVTTGDATFFTTVSTFPAESSTASSEESLIARSPLPERITTTTSLATEQSNDQLEFTSTPMTSLGSQTTAPSAVDKPAPEQGASPPLQLVPSQPTKEFSCRGRRNGYYGDSQDCNVFYVCHSIWLPLGALQKKMDFRCPPQLVFDQRCNDSGVKVSGMQYGSIALAWETAE